MTTHVESFPTQDTAMFRRIVEQGPAISYIAHANDILVPVYISPQVEKVLGTSANTFLQAPQTFFERVHPEDRDFVVASFSGAQASLQPFALEYRMFHTSGHPVWIRDEGCFETAPDGSTLQRGVMVDITARKAAEEALAHRELRYRHITEALSDYVYTVTIRDGEVVKTTHSEGCRALTGYGPEAFHADPYLWLDMVHEEDRAQVLERAHRLMAGEPVNTLFHRLLHKNGSIRWVASTVVPFRDADDRLICFDGVIRDITQQKRAEEAAWEQSHINSMLLDTLPYVAVLIDVEGEILTANRMGVEAHFVRGQDFHTVWGRHFPSAGVGLEEVLQGNTKVCFEVKEKGRTFEATFVPLEPELCLCMLYDITNRKEAEKAVADDKLLIRALMQGAHAAVWLLGTDGTIQSVNAAAAQSVDREAEAMIGKPLADVLPEDVCGCFVENFEQVLSTRNPARFETQRGRQFFDVIMYPVFDERMQLGKVAVFTRDITRRRQGEMQLLEAYQTLSVVIEQSPTAIVALDTEERVKLWNPAAERLLGHCATDVYGTRNPLVPPEQQEGYERGFRSILQKRKNFRRVKAEGLHRDGSRVPLRITASAMLDAAGDVTGVIAILEEDFHRSHQRAKPATAAPDTTPGANI